MAGSPRLIVVEDDPALASVMAAYLETAGFQVTTVGSGREFERAMETGRADLVLLDLDLPDEDGLVLARRLRQRSALPIIMVTGRDAAMDRIVGLELGADDYVTKPFQPRELVARARNLLARSGRLERGAAMPPVQLDGLSVDLEGRVVTSREGAEIRLTRREFDILEALIRAAGRTLSRDSLIDAVTHDEEPDSNRAIDVLISRLRRKLERHPGHPALIATVQGLGYRLTVKPG